MDIFTTHNPLLAAPLRHNGYPDTDMLNSHREILAEQMRINNPAAMTEYTAFNAPPPLKTSAADHYPVYQFVHGQVSPLPSPSEQYAFDSGSDTTSWPRSEQHQPSSLFSGSEPATQIQDTSSAYSSNVHSPSTDATSAVSPMLLLQTTEQNLPEHTNPHTFHFMAEQSPHGHASSHDFDALIAGQSRQDHASPHAFQEKVTQSPVEQQQQLYSQHHHHQMPQQPPLQFHTESTFLNPWHHPVQDAQTLPVEASHFFIPQNAPVSSSSLPYQQHQMRQAPYQPAVRRSEPQIPMHSWGASPVQNHAQRAYASESYPASHGMAPEGLAPQPFPSPAPPHHAAQAQQQFSHGDVYTSAVQHEQEENRRRFAYMQQQHSVHSDPIQSLPYHQLEDYRAVVQEGLQNAPQIMSQAVSPPRASSADMGAPQQHSTGGTKRKRPHNMTSEEKRDLSLQRNREAAAKCRGKKKERDNKTSKQCAALEEKNRSLREEREQMQDQLRTLRDQILAIAASGCGHNMGAITQWIAANSKTRGGLLRRLMMDWTVTTEGREKRKELTKTDVEAAKMVEKMEAEESRAGMDAMSDVGSCDFYMDDNDDDDEVEA